MTTASIGVCGRVGVEISNNASFPAARACSNGGMNHTGSHIMCYYLWVIAALSLLNIGLQKWDGN